MQSQPVVAGGAAGGLAAGLLRAAFSLLESPPSCASVAALADERADRVPLSWELVGVVAAVSFVAGVLALSALEVIGGLRLLWQRSLVEHHDVPSRPRHLASLK